MKKLHLPIECSDEFNEGLSAIKVHLTRELADIVDEMRRAAKAFNLDYVSRLGLGHLVDWYDGKKRVDFPSVDCVELVVSENDIQWQALYAGSSVVLKSHPFYRENLPKARKPSCTKVLVTLNDPGFEPEEGDFFDAVFSALEHFEIPAHIVTV